MWLVSTPPLISPYACVPPEVPAQADNTKAKTAAVNNVFIKFLSIGNLGHHGWGRFDNAPAGDVTSSNVHAVPARCKRP